MINPEMYSSAEITSRENKIEAKETKEEKNLKEGILEIVNSNKEHPSYKVAKEQLDNLSDEEVEQIINKSIEILSSGSNIFQYKIGGDFLTEEGEARNRILSRMDVAENEKYKFLEFVAAKFVPESDLNKREIKIHREIHKRVSQAGKRVSLRVPKILKEYQSEGQMAILMERLPNGPNDMSLQDFVRRSAQIDKVPVVYSPRLDGLITRVYEEFHNLDIIHGDINPGNIYLNNIKYEDVPIRNKAGGGYHYTRIIFNADIALLDFEQAKLINSEYQSGQDLIDTEDVKVADLIEERLIDIDQDSDNQEIAAAFEEWQKSRAA